MEFSSDFRDDILHITLSGDLDETGANTFKARALELDVSSGPSVVIDFARLAFVGSAGIGKLLMFYKKVAANGGSVSLVNMSKDIFTLFTVVKLDKVFTLSRAGS